MRRHDMCVVRLDIELGSVAAAVRHVYISLLLIDVLFMLELANPGCILLTESSMTGRSMLALYH